MLNERRTGSVLVQRATTVVAGCCAVSGGDTEDALLEGPSKREQASRSPKANLGVENLVKALLMDRIGLCLPLQTSSKREEASISEGYCLQVLARV